jgi:ribosomal protein S18 acetylase RimI-like enzyme
MLQIRLASVADLEALTSVFRAASSKIPRPPHPDPGDVVELDAAAISDPIDAGLVHVAESDGVVVGYVASRRCGHPAVPSVRPLQLWQLYVRPAYHGTGVSDRLISIAKDGASRNEHDVIWLGVSEHNGRGIAFYRKHGFAAHGVHEVGASDHAHRDLIMSCVVSPR